VIRPAASRIEAPWTAVFRVCALAKSRAGSFYGCTLILLVGWLARPPVAPAAPNRTLFIAPCVPDLEAEDFCFTVSASILFTLRLPRLGVTLLPTTTISEGLRLGAPTAAALTSIESVAAATKMEDKLLVMLDSSGDSRRLLGDSHH
jgi:hypothetical protein